MVKFFKNFTIENIKLRFNWKINRKILKGIIKKGYIEIVNILRCLLDFMDVLV